MIQANDVLDKKNLILIDQVRFLKKELGAKEYEYNIKIGDMGKQIKALRAEFQTFQYIEQELLQLQQALIGKDKVIFLQREQYE